jgi:hypothetical protein
MRAAGVSMAHVARARQTARLLEQPIDELALV